MFMSKKQRIIATKLQRYSWHIDASPRAELICLVQSLIAQ